MSELRAARRRLAWEIRNNNEHLASDWAGLRSVFSIDYLGNLVAGHVSSLQHVVSTLIDGYMLAFSMFRRHRERKEAAGKCDDCD